jgi:carotenoid 1,2-hydratase
MGVQGLTGACEAGFLHPREQETNPQAKSRPAGSRHAEPLPAGTPSGMRPPSSAFRVAGRVGGGQPGERPIFDPVMPDNGYVWWYCDGRSDCGQYGFTIIAFIGSVFSPYYKWARRSKAADPRKFSCMHVVLYGKKNRWAMTERNAAALAQSPDCLTIGPSSVRWEGDRAIIEIDEVTAPFPQRVRGQITVHCDHVYDRASYLDARREHRWWPINPRARAEVRLNSPDLNWDGHAYFDSNDGDVPLEDSFDYWNWSRASLADGGAAILYDLELKGGGFRSLALRYGTDGKVEDFVSPDLMLKLPRTRWLVERQTRCEPPAKPEVVESWVDAPFYSRSVVSTHLLGESVTAVHESLDMRRFVSPAVQIMLPFKVPRVI